MREGAVQSIGWPTQPRSARQVRPQVAQGVFHVGFFLADGRQTIARKALVGLTLVTHPASYFVWLALPPEVCADRVAVALQEDGISVSTAEPFATSKQVPHALRLALGSVVLDRLDAALQTVRQRVEAQRYR